MVRSMLLPSIFAVLLPVCLISVLPEPGHAFKCKNHVEAELLKLKAEEIDCEEKTKCYASFCQAQKGLLFLNTWLCYGADATQEQCVLEGPTHANEERKKYNQSSNITDWKCGCIFGGVEVPMDNKKIMPPAKMECKYKTESEDATLNEQLKHKHTKLDNIQCIKETGKCGAVFCKAKDGELKLKWRKWACFSSDYAKKACAKNEANAVNDERAKWSDSKLPKADDWKCRCIFGDNGTDMTNEKFVPKNSTAIRHGDGMPMMVVGIIMAILPPFHHAILDQLQMN
ncbi:hypothetical protein niasHT_002882 [Heterodera trifolii]|uniref:Uncharacterized protein n=1 Tax=Heterodera trifolii TaxID=157864 RepID=A0ABD2M5T5_9BILA